MLDELHLADWLDTTELPGKGAPVELKLLAGGAQNEVYELHRGELHCALRIPPTSAPPSRDEGILREWRIIEALEDTDVPCTAAVAVCADTTVLGRSFYLMGYVDGWSPMTSGGWPEPFNSDLELRAGLAYQLVEGIALLSKVDWRAKGLSDLGRPDGFHERQVERWSSFFERSKGRELPGMDLASDWLRAHKPLDFVPGVMHGDYQFANVMYAHGAPARLAAVIDWEMTTIGDPLLDLGWVLISWPPEGDDMTRYVNLDGMPTRDELLKHYEDISGRSTEDIDYYVVLARWKLGIVLEMSYAKLQSGGAVDPKVEAFGTLVLELIRKAAELSRTAKAAKAA